MTSSEELVRLNDKDTCIRLHSSRKHALGFSTENEWEKNTFQAACIPKVPSGYLVRSLACSDTWAAVIVSSFQVYTWGKNAYGQLGLDDFLDRKEPCVVQKIAGIKTLMVACGKSHGAFLGCNGRLYTTGCGLYGRLGLGKDVANRNVKLPSVVKTTQKQLLDGVYQLPQLSSCGYFDQYIASRNASRSSAMDDKQMLLFRKVCCGERHTVAILDVKLPEDKEMKACVVAFGDGSDGRLGVGDDQDRYEPTPVMLYRTLAEDMKSNPCVVDIACGESHSGAICDKGKLYTWGNGGCGRLGHVGFKSELVPRRVEHFVDKVKIRKIACGHQFSFALSEDGQLYKFGFDSQTKNISIPMKIMEDRVIRDVSAGLHIAAAVDNEERAYVWKSDGDVESTFAYDNNSFHLNENTTVESNRLLPFVCCNSDTVFIVSVGVDIPTKAQKATTIQDNGEIPLEDTKVENVPLSLCENYACKQTYFENYMANFQSKVKSSKAGQENHTRKVPEVDLRQPVILKIERKSTKAAYVPIPSVVPLPSPKPSPTSPNRSFSKSSRFSIVDTIPISHTIGFGHAPISPSKIGQKQISNFGSSSRSNFFHPTQFTPGPGAYASPSQSKNTSCSLVYKPPHTVRQIHTIENSLNDKMQPKTPSPRRTIPSHDGFSKHIQHRLQRSKGASPGPGHYDT